jgi:hypothetical protein
VIGVNHRGQRAAWVSGSIVSAALTAFLLAGFGLAPFAAASGTRNDPVIVANGVRLVVPAGWQHVTPASPGPVTDPRTVLVVGTAGVRPLSSQRLPKCEIAAYRIQTAGAAVVIVRWQSTASAGGAPWTPGRAPLAKLRLVHRPSFECFSGRGAAADVLLGGHPYQVNVLVGDRASTTRVAAALAVGRSFDLSR